MRRSNQGIQNEVVRLVVLRFSSKVFFIKCSCGDGNRRYDQKTSLKLIDRHKGCGRISVRIE